MGYNSMLTTIKDRIRQLMETQHMTQQVFATFIGTTSATLSGIFNERTKPTINIIDSIKQKFPDISIEWLMYGNGEMYVHQASAGNEVPPAESAYQSSVQSVEPMIDFESVVQPTPSMGMPVQSTPSVLSPTQTSYNGVRTTPSNHVREAVKLVDKPKRHVTEIRVYYDDQTWESFVPSKK